MKGGLAHHESRSGATLAAAVLKDGSLERTDAWTPLDELMSREPLAPGDPGYDEDQDRVIHLTVSELNEQLHKAKLAGMMGFLRFVWFGSGNLWEAMKRLLAITRKCKPDFIRGMSATQVAAMLGETKAATSAREIRVVEGLLRAWGVIGFQGAGGSKSVAARRKYSEVQKGNTNRADGVARRKDEITNHKIQNTR